MYKHLRRAINIEKPSLLSDLEKLLEFLAAVVPDEGALVQVLVPTDYG